MFFYYLNFSVDGQVSNFSFILFYKFVNPAWTTAAVDNERVIGAVPIVMDILNIHQVTNELLSLIK